MKYTLILLLSGLGLLSSCRSVDELDKLPTASAREQQTISQTVATLEGHRGMWRLVYYPDRERNYGGYSMYLSFANGQVRVLTELNDEPTSSTYAVRNIDMPTLAIDTYNERFHHFSTPTEQFRNARGGDFELQLMGSRGDTILLEGRKIQNRMRLEPIGEDPTEELTAIRAMHERLKGKGLAPTTFGTETNVQLRLVPTYRQLELTPQVAEGATSRTIQVPFHYTPTGIHFYEPLSIGGVTLQELLLDAAGEALSSPDGSIRIPLTEPPLDLMRHRYVARMTRGNAASNFYGSLTSVNRNLRSALSTTLSTTMYLGVNTAADQARGLRGNDTPQTSLIFHEANDAGFTFLLGYEVDFVGLGSDPELLDVVLLDGNESGYWYYYGDTVRPWMNLFQRRAPYRVTQRTESGRTIYRLTSDRSSSYWFDLELAD